MQNTTPIMQNTTPISLLQEQLSNKASQLVVKIFVKRTEIRLKRLDSVHKIKYLSDVED